MGALLRVAAWALLAVAVAVAVAVAGLWLYLASDARKTFTDVPALHGGSVSFGSVGLSDPRDYPDVRLRLDDVRLSDRAFGGERRDVLRLGRLRLDLLADLRSDTLATVRRLTLRGGHLRLHTDSTGVSNLARLLGRGGEGDAEGDTGDHDRDEAEGEAHRCVLLAPDAEVALADVRLDLTHPAKGHDIGIRFDTLAVTDLRWGGGGGASAESGDPPRESGFGVSLLVDAFVDGIQLDAADGPYLDDGRLRGRLRVDLDDGVLHATAPGLDIAGNRVDFAAHYHTDKSDTSELVFAMDTTRLPRARPLLTGKLRRAIAPYDVAGDFASVTTLRHTFRAGDKPIVTVELDLPGNDALVRGARFGDSRVRGRFVNRLPGHDVHAVGYPRGVRFEIDTARTTLEGFDVRSGGALVVSPRGGPTTLRGGALIEGPAAAVTEVIAGEQFAFVAGTARAEATLRGPTGDVTALIVASDADIAFDDAEVVLPEAGVRLPLDSIRVVKRGADAAFVIGGATPGRGNPYFLSGALERFEALLRADAPNRVRSRVAFAAPRLEWRDVVEVLGGAGAGAGAGSEPLLPGEATVQAPAPDSLADVARKATLKDVLRLVEATFDPDLAIAVDTLAYYGFELHDFATGLHFERDGEVVRLERSRFRVDSGEVAFRGTLDIGRPAETPFDFALEARRLDLAALLPEVDYFGQELLADVGTLPDDVDVTIFQRGVVDDVRGLLPNRSEGSIEVVSNHDRPFEASIDFEPDRPDDPAFNSAHVELSGSPELFNGFFQTEDFFFAGGTFDFWLDYAGRVPTVRALLDHEDMGLSVARAGVRFADLDAVLPVTRLDVAVSRDTGEVSVVVRNAAIGQEVRVEGVARNVSEVVYGGTGRPFSADVEVTSPRLVWADLAELIGALADEADTAAPEPLSLQRGLRELLTEFNPRARLAIDELQLADGLTVDDVVGGLWMDADSVLHLDTTGFRYRGGEVEVAGAVALADLALTPFRAHLRTDALDVPGLLEGLGYLDVATLASLRRFEGELSAVADLGGAVTGEGAVLTESLAGAVSLEVRDLAVAGLAPVDTLRSRVGLLEERLAELEFAPIRTNVALDSGVLRVPFTELQSNGFGIWIEGDVGLGGEVDLWATVPLENLSRDYDVVPPLRGEAVPRWRAHVQLASGEAGGLSPKLRLSRRRFYKARGEVARARADRRRWRRARRGGGGGGGGGG